MRGKINNTFHNYLKKPWLKAFICFLGVLFIIFIWWLSSYLINNSVYPGPGKVFSVFFALFIESKTWLAIGESLLRLIISFMISFAIGGLLGILSGYFEAVRLFLKPLVVLLKTIPTAAVILLLIVLLKPNYTLIIVPFLVMFPIIYESFVTGIKEIPLDIINALKVDGGDKKSNSLIRVIIPQASPYILLAMVETLGLGLKSSVMAEILVGSSRSNGIGIAIREAYAYGYTDILLAWALYAIALIGIVDIALYFLQRHFNKDHY